MQLGNGPIGKFAITEKAGAAFAVAVFAMAGVGSLSGVLWANAATVFSAAGVSALTAQSRSTIQGVLTAAGFGTLNPVIFTYSGSVFTGSGVGALICQGARIDNRAISFAGVGALHAITYAFFIDAERACLHQELTEARVPAENSVAIVPFEDSILRVAWEPRTAGSDPLKRIC